MMLRDWYPATLGPGNRLINGKHIFGTVDVYVRGNDYVQQIEKRAFNWENTASVYRATSTYSLLTLENRQLLAFKVSVPPAYPLYTVVEILAVRGSDQFLLGTKKARINRDTNMVYLEPTEKCQKIVGDAVSEHYEYFQLNGVDATNVAIINYLSTTSGSSEFRGFLRLRSPLIHVPEYQPVTLVYGITGEEDKTGSVHTQNIRLIRHEDPLLEGFSNKATDTIRVDADKTETLTKTIQFTNLSTDTVLVDSDVVLTMDTQGRLFGFTAVRSEDLSTLYIFNQDYTVVATDRYNTYSIVRLPSGAIPQDTNILVSYNKLLLHEYCVRVDEESVVFTGSNPSPLVHSGFVRNTWLPESHSDFTLTLDGWNADPALYTVGSLCEARVPKLSRYIKVTYDNGTGAKVMVEDRDFTLKLDPLTNQAYLTRLTTGRIPDNGVVKVTYFYNENLTILSGYPGFVQQVAYQIEQTRHAAADVLVKQMIENAVDVTLSVELNSNTTPEIMDGRIRTAIGNVLSNTRSKITQAEIIRQVKSLNGVANVAVPLTKFAKADGAYNIGHIIPTNTSWLAASSDPTFARLRLPASTWISEFSLLEDSTIPSGGVEDSYVGFLYEGESYRRGMSIQDFVSHPPTPWGGSFYIIGVDDEIDSTTPLPPGYAGRILLIVPSYFSSPMDMNFKVTYQVYREGGQKDITLSPTEFLKAGRVTIDYM
jgi:hypothetical protein